MTDENKEIVAGQESENEELEEQENKGDEGGENIENKGDGQGENLDDNPKPDISDDYEPPVRRSALSYIIERKNRQIEKLKEQENGGGDKNDELEDILTEDQHVISKIVQKQIAPILNSVKNQTDEAELADVMIKHPEAKKIEKSIRKVMSNPAYEQVPVESIFFMLAGQTGSTTDVQGQRDEANRQAAMDKTGGHGRRPREKSEIDFSKMTDKEIEDIANKVKTSQYKP